MLQYDTFSCVHPTFDCRRLLFAFASKSPLFSLKHHVELTAMTSTSRQSRRRTARHSIPLLRLSVLGLSIP
jgi:hypothetical protein